MYKPFTEKAPEIAPLLVGFTCTAVNDVIEKVDDGQEKHLAAMTFTNEHHIAVDVLVRDDGQLLLSDLYVAGNNLVATKNSEPELKLEEDSLEEKKAAIYKVLDGIGIRHNVKGYSYIITAIEKSLADRNKLNSIVKGIYWEIAEENNSTPSRVERSMRHAIGIVWQHGNMSAIDRIFGYTVSAAVGKPTNSEFIAMITDFVSHNYEAINNGTYSFK